MRVWILCEAFVLTGDDFGDQTAPERLTTWGLPCESRKVTMRELKRAVADRVSENYEGLDDADGEIIKSHVRDVMAGGKKLERGVYEYRYSAVDREICWRVYPCEVMR